MRHRRIKPDPAQSAAMALLLAIALALGEPSPSAVAEAGTHVHTADCYEGTLHTCSGSTESGGGCYAGSPSACPNGCVLHTCQGNSWNGGACYDSGSTSTCSRCGGDGTVACSTCNGSGTRPCSGSFEEVGSYEEDCGYCIGTDHAHKEMAVNRRYSCSTCGASYEYRPAATCPHTGLATNGCTNPNCYVNGGSSYTVHGYPCEHTYKNGTGSHNSIGCPATEQCYTCGGSGSVTAYQKDCGKESGKYYVGGSLCPYCGGDNKYYAKTCGKADGEYYDGAGNKCEPVCSMVVTGLAATEASQTLNAGELPVFTAEATFLDGHVGTVACDVSGYSGTSYDTVQDVTLSYGTYKGTAKTKGKTSVSISVYINGYFRLSLSSENTAKGTVGLTGGIPEGGADAGSVTAKVLAGTKPTLTAIPKEGFTFAGWYWGLTKVSGSASYQLAMPAHDYALAARFLGKEVTVSFDADGGTPCPAIRANYLGAYGRLPVPKKAGYVFLGWTRGGRYVTGSSSVSVDSDHTLTAQWAVRGPDYIAVGYGGYYGVNDWAKDKGYVTASNPYGALPLRVPAVFTQPAETKVGYTFLDWYLDETDGRLSAVREESKVINSTRVQINETHWLYATWKEKQFTVSFEPNGGSPCGSITVSYDRKYGFHSPLPVPVRAGYTFTGWYVSSIGGNGDGTQVTDETRVQLLSGQTLYAGWTQDAVEVQVRFEPRTEGQVGLSPEESKALGFGSTIGSIAEGTAERTVTYPGTYGNYTLTWCSCTAEAHKGLPEYGGRHYSIDYSSSYEKLPAASRTGYTFTGWTYKGAAVTAGTGTLAASGHTLFAAYTPNTYVVALDGRGATEQTQASATMTFDAAVPRVEVPEKRGYTFLGYYTGTKGTGTQYYGADGTGMREWLEDSIGITKLYACWEQDELEFPEEKPTPSVTPEATDSISAVFSAASPSVSICSESYSVEKAIPSTEQVTVSAMVGKYSFAGSLSKVTGVDTLRIYVTVPYRTQHEKPDETLEISGVKTKTYAVEVPRAYSYWAVSSADMYIPAGVTVQNGALAGGMADIAADSLTVPYGLVRYAAGEHVQSPGGYDADGTKTISVTCGQTFYVITDTGKAPTEEELAATIGIHAKNFAYQDSTQLKVRSDALTVGGKAILSDEVTASGKGEECDRQAIAYLEENVPLISISGTAELEGLAKNGKYPSAATARYEAYPAGSLSSRKEFGIPANDIVILTPVVIHPTGSTLRHNAGNGDGTYDEDFSITVDEYAEFLDMDLSDVMAGPHISQKGYGTGNYMATASGKRPFDSILLRSGTDLYIDINRDTTLDRTEIGGSGDDLYFPKGAVVRFLTDGSLWYVAGTDGQRVPVDIKKLRLYVLAKDCTASFGITYGALALNGRFTMAYYGYDYESLFVGLRPTEVCIEGANRLFGSYFAYKDVEYEVHYKYITFHWYGAEEKAARPTEDAVVTKQGYEAYFYATQAEGFDGTIEVTPTFSVVDTEGNLIDDDILVMYYDYRPGLLGDMRRYYGITPADDTNTKDFLATWLGAGITEPEISQYWTFSKVSVNQNAMAERTVSGIPMEALHGAYRLPNGVRVLRVSDVPDTPLGTAGEFLSDRFVRDAVIQSDTVLPYVTEGYLRVDLDLSAIYSDGRVLLAHGSIPPITLYYVLGDATDTGLYCQYNGRIPRGDGKDDDYEVDHISIGRPR